MLVVLEEGFRIKAKEREAGPQLAQAGAWTFAENAVHILKAELALDDPLQSACGFRSELHGAISARVADGTVTKLRLVGRDSASR